MMEKRVSFMNVDSVQNVTLDVSNGNNNLMIEVTNTLGQSNLIVIHPSVFNEIMYLAKDVQLEKFFSPIL